MRKKLRISKNVAIIILLGIDFLFLFNVINEIKNQVVHIGYSFRADPLRWFVANGGDYSLKDSPDVYNFALYFHIIALVILFFVTFLVVKDRKKALGG